MKTILTMFLLGFSVLAAAWDSNPYAVESAVYKVEVPYGIRVGFGTGVLVAPGRILTNCHVLKLTPGWPVVVNRKTGEKFQVRKHYNLGNYDACVLVGSFSGTPVIISNTISDGDPVWLYGYPRGITALGQGVITKIVSEPRGWTIYSTIFCNPGSSGGPLLNVKGQLIGLHYGHQTGGGPDQCLSIPAFLLEPYLKN